MILGVDPGARRIGVAIAHPDTRLAMPLEVIDARAVDPIARIAELVRERGVTAIVVGLPLGLAGGRGAAARAQGHFVASLRAATTVEVGEFDERFTSVVAARGLRETHRGRQERRGPVDAVAAQVMLQGYLDSTA